MVKAKRDFLWGKALLLKGTGAGIVGGCGGPNLEAKRDCCGG